MMLSIESGNLAVLIGGYEKTEDFGTAVNNLYKKGLKYQNVCYTIIIIVNREEEYEF